MSFVGYNFLSVTGFQSDKGRFEFKAAVSKGKSALSFVTIFPIEEGDDWDQKVKENWGAWIYDHEEGEPGLCYVNTVEEFNIMKETGLIFRFRTHNGYPDHGIRNLSKLYPGLLFKLHSYDDYGFEGFIAYQNGNCVYLHSMNNLDSEEVPLLDVMRFAHHYNGYWWEHPDINYFRFFRLGFPEKCIQREEEGDDDIPF